MKIKTKNNYPITRPGDDWEAHVDGEEEGFVGRGPTEEAAIIDLKIALGELMECPRCGEYAHPSEIEEYEDRDDETGYRAIEEYCSKCDPRKLANQREAAAEAAYYSKMKEF